MFGNPVLGTIRPHSDPPGPYWRVTATFGQVDADHPTPHEGVDIGNMKCGDPVIAVADGTVSLSGFLGAALVVRVLHPQFPGYESGYAHLSSKYVVVGQAVKRGQVLGTLGSTGATACHLHWGTKLNGVEVDGWPLLDQNVEDEMVPIPGAAYSGLVNKKTSTTTGANFRADRLTTAPVHAVYPVGTGFKPSVSANDGSPAGGATPTLWYGGFLYDDPAGYVFGWFHSSVVGPLVDDIATGGHTDQELQDTARKAAHNAAVDVEAVGVTALNSAAAKYP